MAIETTYDLSQDTIHALQELIQVNVDSRDNLRYAAEKTEDMNISGLFLRVAEEREAQADELGRFVTLNAETPKREGSFYASFQRTMLAAREALSSNNAYTVLAEAERCEDQIKAAYERQLKKHPGTAVNDVLNAQYARVLTSHDHIRDLRDSYKE